MAWNEPPGGNNDQDPWGNRDRNKKNDGPPELDDIIKDINQKLNKWFGGGSGGKGGDGKNTSGGSGMGPVLAILVVGALVFTGFNSVYTVDESERAVVLRLGEFSRVETPGLQFKIPYVDQIASKVNVTQIREHSLQNSMLTADENIVTVSMTVEYLAADAQSYALNVRDPESTMTHAAESALRHVVGSARLEQILTTGRDQVQALVKDRLQDYLDAYDVGITLAELKITDASPPSAVQDAFDDVIKAREDQQRLVNEAQTYANGIVPVAQGQAARQIAEAEAFRQEVIARATGEADRFSALYAEYNKAPEITRQRLYLDTLEGIYANSSKVLMDVEGGNNMMYLPLDQLLKGQTAAAANSLTSGGSSTSSVSNMSQTDVSDLTDQILREINRRNNQ
ncbi:FtsH protease activity modulator HflK [Reinekea sp.]|jgi:membrane protease subunit HflK|uniref:FtsH protease activity modulator HflK n=1 Tax=Reinekea sp. TaxID=1970455 RepID=UPI003988CE4F